MKPGALGLIDVVKRVVVIASGQTERRAVPHLVSHLEMTGISLADVRIPPRNQALNAGLATKLIKAAWYEEPNRRPNKFVVVVDTDQAEPDNVVGPIREGLQDRLSGIDADVLYAYAQQHLEAWYFADSRSLRNILGRALGQIDASKPDEIENPKLHLKHMLNDRIYTARVSEDIARRLNAETIAERSPSFKGFLQAYTNGSSSEDRGQPP